MVLNQAGTASLGHRISFTPDHDTRLHRLDRTSSPQPHSRPRRADILVELPKYRNANINDTLALPLRYSIRWYRDMPQLTLVHLHNYLGSRSIISHEISSTYTTPYLLARATYSVSVLLPLLLLLLQSIT
jgi:hypothetical protein